MRNAIAEECFRFRWWTRPIGIFLQIFVGWLDDIKDFLSLKSFSFVSRERNLTFVLEQLNTKRSIRRNQHENLCTMLADSWDNISWLQVVENSRNDLHRFHRRLHRCPLTKLFVVDSVSANSPFSFVDHHQRSSLARRQLTPTKVLEQFEVELSVRLI